MNNNGSGPYSHAAHCIAREMHMNKTIMKININLQHYRGETK